MMPWMVGREGKGPRWLVKAAPHRAWQGAEGSPLTLDP